MLNSELEGMTLSNSKSEPIPHRQEQKLFPAGVLHL